MDKRIQVKFENIIPSKNEESSNKSISKETKSKIVKNNKPVNNQVTSKSPDNKKVIKDKKGNVVIRLRKAKEDDHWSYLFKQKYVGEN